MLGAKAAHAQREDLVVTDQGIDPSTRSTGFVLQPAHKIDDRDAIRTTVEVVAQEGQAGLTPTPGAVDTEQRRMPKRGDQLLSMPVHVADYIVHLPNLRTLRTMR